MHLLNYLFGWLAKKCCPGRYRLFTKVSVIHSEFSEKNQVSEHDVGRAAVFCCCLLLCPEMTSEKSIQMIRDENSL
jgi:hypothetical protein